MDFFRKNGKKILVKHNKKFLETGVQLSEYFLIDKWYIEVVCEERTINNSTPIIMDQNNYCCKLVPISALNNSVRTPFWLVV